MINMEYNNVTLAGGDEERLAGEGPTISGTNRSDVLYYSCGGIGGEEPQRRGREGGDKQTPPPPPLGVLPPLRDHNRTFGD